MVERPKNEWMCIGCGRSLGHVYGSEYYPTVEGKYLHTSGPNLVVTCPDCGAIKTFYTSDQIVRSLYQLINAMTDQVARAMVEQVGKAVNRIPKDT
jgi:Zn-finger protein